MWINIPNYKKFYRLKPNIIHLSFLISPNNKIFHLQEENTFLIIYIFFLEKNLNLKFYFIISKSYLFTIFYAFVSPFLIIIVWLKRSRILFFHWNELIEGNKDIPNHFLGHMEVETIPRFRIKKKKWKLVIKKWGVFWTCVHQNCEQLIN